MMMRSCVCSSSAAFVTEIPGNVTGMNNSVPSFRLGMNSLPSRVTGQKVAPSTTSATSTATKGTRSTSRITGR